MPEKDDDFLPIAVFREFEKRIDSDIKHNADVMKIVHESAKEAVTKAETANSKRFDSFNEFNQRMNDLSATYLSRETYGASQAGIENRLRALENSKNIGTGRSAISEPLLMFLVASAGGLLSFFIQMLFRK